jgi:two-component system, OmpR family, sensor histidine kinase KdpD
MLVNKSNRYRFFRFAAGIGLVLFATAFSFYFHFNLSAATSLHLLFVVLIALQWGFPEASVASLLSVGCLDYFFTEPLFQLTIANRHDWLALIIFETVALLVSRLSSKLKIHAAAADAQRSRLQMLYELSQNILLLNRHEAAEPQLVNLIRTILKVGSVSLWDAYEVRLYQSPNSAITEDEVRSVFFTEQDTDDSANAISKRVLRIGTRPIGSLVFCDHSLDAMTVDAVASLTAIAIERARSFSAETNAEAARRSEQLRSTVLDALAHAYKTPLTTIKSSSSGMLEIGSLSEVQKDLVSLIDDEVEHLIELTDRLLRTAELDRASLKLKRREVNSLELVGDVVNQYKKDTNQHVFEIETPTSGIVILADRHLMRMVLEQLLDNAIKYACPHSRISVGVRDDEVETIISVHNEGSFIPREERQRIFERFYRGLGSEHRAAGTGIGLSVARRITEAHHGRIWVDSDPEAGTTFFIALPRMTKEK